MTEFIKDFAANYEVEDDPSQPLGERSFDFVAEGVSALAPSVEISVTPASGIPWHGRFFGDDVGLNVVANGPSPEVLVVVAAGVAYVVPVDSPSDYHPLAIWPVRSILCVPMLGLVLFLGFTGVVALGEGGTVRWEAMNLVSDGFTDSRLMASMLTVKGYVAPEGRDVETTLDLATGLVLERK